MEIAKNILTVVYSILCVILIIIVLSQTKEDSGASSTVMGASANNFYEKNKGRTREGKIKKLTIALTIVYFILTIAIGILYNI